MHIQKNNFCALVVLSLILVFTAGYAFAWPPLFGYEFEFTTKKLSKTKAVSFTSEDQKLHEEALIQFLNSYQELFPEAIIIASVKHNADIAAYINVNPSRMDSFTFTVAMRAGGYEITGDPHTVGYYKNKADLYEKYIFEPVKKMGLITTAGSAGHISIGNRSGFTNKTLFNFIVDMQNWHELFRGVLGNDLANGPPLAIQTRAQQLQFAKVLKKYSDIFFVQNDRSKSSRLAFTHEINRKVYTTSFIWTELDGADHFQNINLEEIIETQSEALQRLEIRSIYAQTSMQQFILLAELLQKRLEYLKTFDQALKYEPHFFPTYGKDQFLVNQFYKFVTETGLEWDTYRHLLPKNLRGRTPKGYQKSCDGILF